MTSGILYYENCNSPADYPFHPNTTCQHNAMNDLPPDFILLLKYIISFSALIVYPAYYAAQKFAVQ